VYHQHPGSSSEILIIYLKISYTVDSMNFKVFIHVELLQNWMYNTFIFNLQAFELYFSHQNFHQTTERNFVWWKFHYSYQFVVGLGLFIFFMHRFSENSWCLFWHFLLHTHIPSQLLINFCSKHHIGRVDSRHFEKQKQGVNFVQWFSINFTVNWLENINENME
jgi:hypothetical protein